MASVQRHVVAPHIGSPSHSSPGSIAWFPQQGSPPLQLQTVGSGSQSPNVQSSPHVRVPGQIVPAVVQTDVRPGRHWIGSIRRHSSDHVQLVASQGR